jgi:FKBP-type peptidyl-prolyl cis-trans isomerase
MAREGPGMRAAASGAGALPPRSAGRGARLGAVAALALAACAASRARAQMSADSWSTDPMVTSQNSWQTARFRSGPNFPLPAYGAIGSSLARTGHFAEIGWNETQVAAFLDGMRAAFQGKPTALDDKAQQLLSAMGRQSTGREPAQPGAGNAGGSDLPLSSCGAIGSFLAVTGHFAELGWSEPQVGAFLDGMGAALRGKPFALDDQARQLLSDIGRQISDIAEIRKLEAPRSLDPAGKLEWYMRKVRNRLGLQQSESGLAYRVERGRGGVRPRPGDTIVFTCTAIAADGSTRLPQLSGEKVRAKLDGLLPGLMEGLQMMTVDGSAVFVLPPGLSFGENPWPDGVQRGSPIIFTVTLVDVAPREASP